MFENNKAMLKGKLQVLEGVVESNDTNNIIDDIRSEQNKIFDKYEDLLIGLGEDFERDINELKCELERSNKLVKALELEKEERNDEPKANNYEEIKIDM